MKNSRFSKNQVKCFWNTLHTQRVGLSYAIYSRITLHALSYTYKARDSSREWQFFPDRRKPLVLWWPFELVFYCPPGTIYCRCSRPGFTISPFLIRARSFTLTPDISARIDYASSSLSDVLVSIGDRCGRNAHVPVFSTRIAQFPMPV